MRRYLALALSILAALLVVYVIHSAGSERHTKAAAAKPIPLAQQTATTSTQPTTTTDTTPVVTATRTNCRWRQYSDGAIGTDLSCAPGKINPAIVGHTAQTICKPAWLARASRIQPSPTTRDKLLIEYQLPGSPLTYVAARVIPVEDGGSPTSALNLYPLPLDGYGGQQTRTLVADQLRDEICSHKITVAQAAKTLERDWLAKGLPDDD
jgi:hypothetical protein